MIARKTGQQDFVDKLYANGALGLLRQPVVFLDQFHRILVASKPFHHLFGTTPQSTVGRTLREVCDGLLDVPGLQEFLDLVQSDPMRINDFRFEVNKRLEGRRTFALSAQRIPANLSGPTTIVAIEETIQPVLDRASEDDHAARAYQQDHQALPSMAAANHDLRQPLQTLSLLQGLLAARVKDPDLSALIARAEQAIEALTGMLNAIASVNQLNTGSISPTIQSFAIGSVIKHLRTELAYHADARGLELRVVPSDVTVRSDPQLLEQVLRALLIDAMKLIKRGKVLFGCRRRSHHLILQVWIKGTGVSAEQQAAILSELGEHGGSSTAASLVGMLVKPLSDQLHLAVQARSRSGDGLVFTAKVPLEPQLAERTIRRSGTSKGTIVVASDDPRVRDVLVLLLREMGHEALMTSVEDGFASLTSNKSGSVRPETVIVDFNRGIEVSKKVVASIRWMFGWDIPAIVFGENEGTGDAIGEPCVFLPKPVRPSELAPQIARLLALARRHAATLRRLHRDALPQTVFVVDDDGVLRDAVRDVLGEQGQDVELFSNSENFLEIYNRDRRGCLVIDNRLPGMTGVELLERLKSDGSTLPAVMITGHGDTSTAVRALKAGAIDYIEKPISYEALLTAVEHALEIDRGSANALIRRRELAARLAELTPRERQVMDLVVTGQSSKKIAQTLKISQRTVENHRAAIMKRADVTSLSDLIRIVMQVQLSEGR